MTHNTRAGWVLALPWLSFGADLYRFDDRLASAAISAPAIASSSRVAEPLIWEKFLSEEQIAWTLLRGRIGLRKGELIVAGDGATPVILSPKETAIDWSLYEAVRVRMLAEGGDEIKVKIGDLELKQPIAQTREYQVYRFDVNVDAPRGSRPLAVMPTNSPDALVAISFIELVPRRTNFTRAAGKLNIGKREDYRNVLYAHSPSAITYPVAVPPESLLHFSTGIAQKDRPVSFRVSVGSVELFAKTVSDADSWDDAEVDLSRYAGRTIQLRFETKADRAGVGFWANPLLAAKTPRSRPNVLIYMIDTLRADHTSLYGYKRDTTPFLKSLAASGVVFEDCQAQATWTKASVASLMTSAYSYTHGIVNDYDTIPKGAATLAEQMRSAGYVTGSMIANPFAGRTTGLQRGFDYMMEFPVVHRYRTEKADRGTDSAAMNRVVTPWLDTHRDEPFFLYVHTTDPHAPYRPPPGFEEKFASPAETSGFDRDYARLRDQRQYGGGTVISRANAQQSGVNPDRFLAQAVDRYDGEILFNDHNLKLLVDKLRQIGVLDNTLIVVVSDHGEEFWDHGWTAHGHSLYQELTHVVWMMWNPKLLPTPRRITETAQLVDVMPTLLDLLGVKMPDLVQGQSLVPLLLGRPFRRRGPVMTSRFAHPGAKPDGFVPENRTDSFALLEPSWKLISRNKAKEAGIAPVELYDRRTDRVEAKNVAANHPEQVSRMLAEIEKWRVAQLKIKTLLGPGGQTALDPATIEQLRSLGYVGGKQ